MRSTQLVQRAASLLFMFTFIFGPSASIFPKSQADEVERPDQVLEWNQVFIDTLIATNTANAASQRLGAIVQIAIFDAYNGIERRYTPFFYAAEAPRGASRRAAVIAAAHTALIRLFPSRTTQLDEKYSESLDALTDGEDSGGMSAARGIEWGNEVANAVLAWRATDGFSSSLPSFFGGTEIGQWRSTLTSTGALCNNANGMSAQTLGVTQPFAVASREQFWPGPPRGLMSGTYVDDFNSVKALGRNTASVRTVDQTWLAPFWEGNASTHWNQAANQIARANHSSMSDNSRLFAVLNIAMADAAFTIWSAKKFYSSDPSFVTWRAATAIPEADLDGNPDTVGDVDWKPLISTPCHSEYPAGHPAQNGAAAAILLANFDDGQTFTLTTGANSRTYHSISQARSDGNNARVWGGMHYPSTVEVSDGVGEAVADHVNTNTMLYE